jgi:hypothetical protein
VAGDFDYKCPGRSTRVRSWGQVLATSRMVLLIVIVTMVAITLDMIIRSIITMIQFYIVY